MVDIKRLQEQIYANKVAHGFNITSVDEEVCHIMSELAEAWEAYRKKGKAEFAEELADVAIFLLGLAEMQGIDLESEILNKIEKNAQRKYHRLDNGVMIKD